MKSGKKKYIPARGDIIWLSFNPRTGHEQGGKRPAITLTPKIYNEKVGLGIFCPVTSKIKGYPFEIPVNGKIDGVILADQIKSLDWQKRNAEFITKAGNRVLSEIRKKLELLLF